MNWINNFSEIEQSRIETAMHRPNVGVPLDQIIIAKMAELLNKVQDTLLSDNFDAEIAPLARQALGVEDVN